MVMISERNISLQLGSPGFKRRDKKLSILMDINNFLATALRLPEVLDGALCKILDHFGFKAGRIYLMDQDGEVLTLAASIGIDPKGLERVRLTEGFSGKAARTRSFVAQRVSDLEDRERAHLLLKQGLKVIVCLPLMVSDRVLGVMNLAADRPLRLSHSKIDLLVAIGNATAIAADHARLYEELEMKVREAKEKKDAIEFFAHTISHDLKSPAIAIHGLVKLLKKRQQDTADEKTVMYCASIMRASEQIVGLVEEINAYLRAKDAPLSFEKISIEEVTGAIRSSFQDQLNERRIKWVEPETIPEIMADKLCLVRAFQNLVENALKYGGEGLSEIRIDFREDSKFNILSVSDNGVGVSSEDSGKLFKPFWRHKTAARTEGTGLGLAIVKEIADRHRGSVWVENAGGTVFCFSISKDLETGASGQKPFRC
jgi:signal transduction histidine kinase